MAVAVALRGQVLELGGGANPCHRPNADIRWGPCTDIPCDFNHPLPIPSASYEGVHARYTLEHVSHRRIRGLLAEVHRILKPGGVLVAEVPNTLEQAKVMASAERWEDWHLVMLFGDGDYPENFHRTGFSPEYITRLLHEAGFYTVEVAPLPECDTDMVVVARKSQAQVKVK